MADDYWTGYVHGHATGSSSSSGGGAGGIAIALLMVAAAAAAAVAGAGVVAFVALYPIATVLVIVGVAILTVVFSAGVGIVWHDPSPIYLFGTHWLYFHWVGLVLAGLVGLWFAFLAVVFVEYRLHDKPVFYGLRHLWRVLMPAVTVATILHETQKDTGLTTWGLWLIPVAIAVALHFGLWSEKWSLRRNWLESRTET